jgi:flavodoxin
MMIIRIAYHSLTGNTRKVAEAIAGSFGFRAISIRDLEGELNADILFLGGAVYRHHGQGLHQEMRHFIKGLKPAKVKRAVVFSTGFSPRNSALLRATIEAHGIPVHTESFHCPGRFLFCDRPHPNRLFAIYRILPIARTA